MTKFSTALLQTEKGLIGPHPLEGYFIRVPIKPFLLNDEVIETVIRLDCVILPTEDLSSLSGCTLNFPINPDDGYIDGSLYIGSSHHPLDVHGIAFADANGNSIKAAIACEIDFEFEGLEDFGKTAWKFEVLLDWTDKQQNA